MSKLGSALWIAFAAGAPLLVAFTGCNTLTDPYGADSIQEKNIRPGSMPPIGTHFSGAGGYPSLTASGGASGSSSSGAASSGGPVNLCACQAADLDVAHSVQCDICYSTGCDALATTCGASTTCVATTVPCLESCVRADAGVDGSCVAACLARADQDYMNLLNCRCVQCASVCTYPSITTCNLAPVLDAGVDANL